MELGISTGGGSGTIIREFEAGVNISKGDLILINNEKAIKYKENTNTNSVDKSGGAPRGYSIIENENYIILFFGGWGSASKCNIGTKNADGSIMWSSRDTSTGFSASAPNAYIQPKGMFIENFGDNSGAVIIGYDTAGSYSKLTPSVYIFEINAGIITFTKITDPEASQRSLGMVLPNVFMDANGNFSVYRIGYNTDTNNGSACKMTSLFSYVATKTGFTNTEFNIDKVISGDGGGGGSSGTGSNLTFNVRKVIGNNIIGEVGVYTYWNGYTGFVATRDIVFYYDENHHLQFTLKDKKNIIRPNYESEFIIQSTANTIYNYNLIDRMKLLFDKNNIIGIATVDATSGSNVRIKLITPYQEFDYFTGLTAGKKYYIDMNGLTDIENDFCLGTAIDNKTILTDANCGIFNN